MVKLKNCNIIEFAELIIGKKLFCFGSGRQAEGFFSKYRELKLEDSLCGFIDNDVEKQGKEKIIFEKFIPIYSFNEFVKRADDSTIVLTTSMYCPYMIEQMDREEKLDGLFCYIDFLVENKYCEQKINLKCAGEYRIPKVIHYCWFGKKEIPEQFVQYMETWKEKCPDYQIIKWDESNYDLNSSNYVRQAYNHQKWAFVSDFARLDIIYQYGGIYLDTDVELIQNLDPLRYDDFFCGFEQNNYVNFGLGFGAVKGHPVLKNLLSKYKSMNFELPNGELNLTACAIYQSEEMVDQGFKIKNEYQFRNGMSLYPSEVFAPYDLLGLNDFVTQNTFSIHHYSSTWWDKKAEMSMEYLKTKLCEYIKRIEFVD